MDYLRLFDDDDHYDENKLLYVRESLASAQKGWLDRIDAKA